MKKVINYIKFGRGIGARWLALYALIGAIVFGILCKSLGDMATPALQNVADQLLPIKVENGVIVEPQNVIKTVKFEIKDVEQFPVVLDTTVDNINTVNIPDGIYISKKAVYFVDRDKTTVKSFSGSVELLKSDYTGLFKKMSIYGGLIMGVFAFIILFAVYLFLAAFYAIFAVMLAKFYDVFFNYSAAMRLSSLAYIATSLLMFILNWCGISTPTWLYFVAVVTLLILAFRLLYPQETPTKHIHKI